LSLCKCFQLLLASCLFIDQSRFREEFNLHSIFHEKSEAITESVPLRHDCLWDFAWIILCEIFLSFSDPSH
jgi:hypothetical protein